VRGSWGVCHRLYFLASSAKLSVKLDMSFEEEYNAAKSKMLEVRGKLIKEVLGSPAADANAMLAYYNRYKAFQESIPLVPRVFEIGEDFFVALGKKPTDRPVKHRAVYDGPVRPYTDTGQTPEKTFYLPSVPVLTWDRKPGGPIGEDMIKEHLKTSFVIYSTEVIAGVEPDFENANYKYYFPRAVYYDDVETTDGLYFTTADVEQIGEEMAIIVPTQVKGIGVYVRWEQLPKGTFAYVRPNAEVVMTARPLPSWHDPSWTREEEEIRKRGYVSITFHTLGYTYNYIFFNHTIRAERKEEAGYKYDPVFVLGTAGGKLDPPVLLGRIRIA